MIVYSKFAESYIPFGTIILNLFEVVCALSILGSANIVCPAFCFLVPTVKVPATYSKPSGILTITRPFSPVLNPGSEEAIVCTPLNLAPLPGTQLLAFPS